MLHQLSKQFFLGIFVVLLLVATPGYAVETFKTSTYGTGHQIWFEVEDYDERNPDNDDGFALSDEPGAFGRSITQTSGSDGAYLLRYDFDISKAGGKGGTWYRGCSGRWVLQRISAFSPRRCAHSLLYDPLPRGEGIFCRKRPPCRRDLRNCGPRGRGRAPATRPGRVHGTGSLPAARSRRRRNR